jgi:hypothetical protein
MTTGAGEPRGDKIALFAGLMALVGVGMLLALDFVPEWRTNYTYVEGRCLVLDKRLGEHPPTGKAVNSTYRPEFFIRYTVDGKQYELWAYDATGDYTALRRPKERILESFTVGQQYSCWYEPEDPSKVVLVRGYSWVSNAPLLVIFVVLAFFTGRGLFRHLRRTRITADKANGA